VERASDTEPLTGTLAVVTVAPSAGAVMLRRGAVPSTLTVMDVEATLPAASLA
jgi:hypothetical protein